MKHKKRGIGCKAEGSWRWAGCVEWVVGGGSTDEDGSPGAGLGQVERVQVELSYVRALAGRPGCSNGNGRWSRRERSDEWRHSLARRCLHGCDTRANSDERASRVENAEEMNELSDL